MSFEVIVPFQLDPHGRVAETQDPHVQAAQHVSALVRTEPGERVMIPSYGIPLKDYVFDPGFAAVTTQIVNDVRRSMAAWEPTINVEAVTPIGGYEFGVSDLEVDYSIGITDSDPVNTATVLVGGTVIESTG